MYSETFSNRRSILRNDVGSNATTGKDVPFGIFVDDEMCFLWAYYFPSRGPLVCANGLFPCN
jgi:hypothetical protein